MASKKIIPYHPIIVMFCDMLWDRNEGPRGLPLRERRVRLERRYARNRPQRTDLSPLIPFRTMEELRELRATAGAPGMEGLMLKRADRARSWRGDRRDSGGRGSGRRFRSMRW